MPRLLRFYSGGVTRDEFWRLSLRELRALVAHQNDVERRERADLEQLHADVERMRGAR